MQSKEEKRELIDFLTEKKVIVYECGEIRDFDSCSIKILKMFKSIVTEDFKKWKKDDLLKTAQSWGIFDGVSSTYRLRKQDIIDIIMKWSKIPSEFQINVKMPFSELISKGEKIPKVSFSGFFFTMQNINVLFPNALNSSEAETMFRNYVGNIPHMKKDDGFYLFPEF